MLHMCGIRFHKYETQTRIENRCKCYSRLRLNYVPRWFTVRRNWRYFFHHKVKQHSWEYKSCIQIRNTFYKSVNPHKLKSETQLKQRFNPFGSAVKQKLSNKKLYNYRISIASALFLNSILNSLYLAKHKPNKLNPMARK